MTTRTPVSFRQRGVAVITALLLTTLAVTLVASLFWQQQVQARSIENQRLQLQGQWILRGALDWAQLILREDARFTSVDQLDEPWAVPLAETRLDQYVENGRAGFDPATAVLSGHIVDAQSRYNLTNLCVGGIINLREVAVFERLLAQAGIDPRLAQATADAMAATSKKSVNSSTSAFVFTSNTQGGPPSDLRQMPIEQIDDLLTVPGFSAEAIHKLTDFVVVLPRATPINVNTASAEILAARIETLSSSAAAALIEMRQHAYFRDTGDFMQRLQGKSVISAPDQLSVATSYFIVNGKVRLSRASLHMQALIERNGSITKVIWMRGN